MRYFLFVVLVLALNSTASAQTYVDYYRQGVSAYEQQNFEEFLNSFRKADSLRPNHRVLLYNLAVGYALTNQQEKAFQVLDYRLGFYAVNDFDGDEDFKSLVNKGYMDSLKIKRNKKNAPQKKSTTAFEVSIDGLHAEGITFNDENQRFYITDVRNGWIYSVGMNGEEPRKEIDLKDFGFWSAMGIKFDPGNSNFLWVTTSAMQNFIGYTDSLEGRSAILKINLSSKELTDRYEIEGSHVFGDLIFGKDGSLLISDSDQPTIYKLDPNKGILQKFISEERWWNLQGIAFSEDEKILYVSDYITGIYKVDVKTKKVGQLSEENQLLRGSDGIYLKGNKLVMLQNGASPKRVAQINIDSEGLGITSSIHYPDKALSELDEPTLGTIVGHNLYYIANSPWAHYDENGQPIKNDWLPLKINKLSLE